MNHRKFTCSSLTEVINSFRIVTECRPSSKEFHTLAPIKVIDFKTKFVVFLRKTTRLLVPLQHFTLLRIYMYDKKVTNNNNSVNSKNRFSNKIVYLRKKFPQFQFDLLRILQLFAQKLPSFPENNLSFFSYMVILPSAWPLITSLPV